MAITFTPKPPPSSVNRSHAAQQAASNYNMPGMQGMAMTGNINNVNHLLSMLFNFGQQFGSMDQIYSNIPGQNGRPGIRPPSRGSSNTYSPTRTTNTQTRNDQNFGATREKISSLKEDLKTAKANVKIYEEKQTDLTKIITEKETDLKDIGMKQQTNKINMALTNSELIDVHDRIKDLNHEIDKQTALHNARGDGGDEMGQYYALALIREKKKEVAELTTKQSNLVNEKNFLEKEKNDLLVDIDDIETSLSGYQSALDKVEKTLETYETEVIGLEAVIENLYDS